MNAAERSRTLLPVLVVVQLSTGCIQPLVRGVIVSSKHLKVGRQIHAVQITPVQTGRAFVAAEWLAGKGRGVFALRNQEPGGNKFGSAVEAKLPATMAFGLRFKVPAA